MQGVRIGSGAEEEAGSREEQIRLALGDGKPGQELERGGVRSAV
jgi:hypothetical protein